MSAETIARRYATALADVVIPRGEDRAVQEELSQWEAMMQSNQMLQEVFGNPTIPYDQKRKVLMTLIARTHVGSLTANFLQVLLQNHRLGDLTEVNKRFAQVLDERAGVVTAEVQTVHLVPEASQQALRAKLMTLTGKKVHLKFSTDEDLIGGIVTRIGSTIYDGSVRSQLQQVKQKMASGS